MLSLPSISKIKTSFVHQPDKLLKLIANPKSSTKVEVQDIILNTHSVTILIIGTSQETRKELSKKLGALTLALASSPLKKNKLLQLSSIKSTQRAV